MSKTELRTGFIAAIGLSALMLLNRGAFADNTKPGNNLKKEQEVATAKQTLTEAQQIAAIHIPWEEQRGQGLTHEDVMLVAGMDSRLSKGLVLVYCANGTKSDHQKITRDDFDAPNGEVYAEARVAMQTLKHRGHTVNKIALTDSHDNISVLYNGMTLFTMPDVGVGSGGLTTAIIKSQKKS